MLPPPPISTLFPYTTLFRSPFFQGHFPGHPVMPGVMQVEAMAQVASLLLFKLAKTTSRIGYFMSADEVKFRKPVTPGRSEEHTSELQSHSDLVCRLLLEKKK